MKPCPTQMHNTQETCRSCSRSLVSNSNGLKPRTLHHNPHRSLDFSTHTKSRQNTSYLSSWFTSARAVTSASTAALSPFCEAACNAVTPPLYTTMMLQMYGKAYMRIHECMGLYLFAMTGLAPASIKYCKSVSETI